MASQTTTKVAADTGAAKDDVLPSAATGLDEDNSSAALAVLANDPGAARLYSLAQDVSGLVRTAQFPVATGAILPSGAVITINPDGTVGYDAGGVGAALQACAQGEFFTDSFVYTVRMANGALSTATVTLEIAGANDAPTLAAAAPVALLDTADDDTPGLLTGKLGGADVDHGSVLAYSLLGGGLTASTVYGTLTLDPATGAYSFAADPDQIDALGAGMTAAARFTVQVKDEHGAASAPLVLTFNLIGANDTASISGTGSGSVGEDGALAATGSLAVHDRDTGESVFAAPATLSGTYGDFTLDEQTGQWAYTLRNAEANVQALGAGKVVTDEIVVTSLDGTASASLHVEIAGANDAASIGGLATGAVAEDGILAAGGILTVHDVDAGEAIFRAPASLAGTYGDFTFDQQTGQWAYGLRNADANVQALGAGKVVADDIVVTSLDGTASASLHVEIAGANDAASIGGVATGAVAEDGTLTASGLLTVQDLDAGEASFRAPASLAGTYGDFTFDQQTGQWTYGLRNGDANVQALGAGKLVTDEIIVTSLDGTASASLHVTIAGANDAAIIGGAAIGSVAEDGTLTASGLLTVQDADTGEAVFRAPPSLAGTYGDFTFDTGTGAWSYLLRNGDANVQALSTGQQVFDELVVASLDGSASQTIRVNVAGADEMVVANPVRTFQVSRGQADSNDRIYFSGFDDNDLLAYANNLSYVGHGLADTNGDGVADASTATFEFANNGGKVAHIVVVLVGYTGLTDAQVGH